MSIAISIAALSVSLFTLWLTRLRRGHFELATPKHWAGTVTDRKIVILLPLAIANSGTRTRVIHDLRLIFLDEEEQPLEFVRIRSELRPETAGEPSFASPFVVAPESAIVRFCEFQREPGRTPQAGSWPVRLEVQTSDKPEEWRSMLVFKWGVELESVGTLNAFIAHRNAAAAN